MKHKTRISAIVLFAGLAALCIFDNPIHWQKTASATTHGEAPPAPVSAMRRQAELALFALGQPVVGQGPTKLEPSTEIEALLDDDLLQGQLCIDETGPLVHDPQIETYLQERAEELLKDAPDYARIFPTKVFLNRDPQHHNARAAGGGYVLMSLDLLAHASSEEFFLFTLCHEMGHNFLRHAAQRKTLFRVLLEQEYALEAQLKLDEVKADPHKFGRLELALKHVIGEQMAKTRACWHLTELDADVFAIQLLYRAGYDVSKVTEAWWRKAPSFRLGPHELDTHPHDATRALRMELERTELAGTPRRVRPADQNRFMSVQARAKALIAPR